MLVKVVSIFRIMLPFVSRPVVAFFSGLVLSYLEMSGSVSPVSHDANLQTTQTLVGGVLGAITLLSFFIHDAKTKNVQTAVTDTEKRFNLLSLFARLKNFILKPSQPATEVAPAVETVEQPAA